MLLVIDVGNTNIVLGAMEGDKVVHHWRVTTAPRTTKPNQITISRTATTASVVKTNTTNS